MNTFAWSLANYFNLWLFIRPNQIPTNFGQVFYAAAGHLFDKNLSILSSFKTSLNQIHCLVQRHYKASHFWICNGKGLSFFSLL
jgi:hypothetical protein